MRLSVLMGMSRKLNCYKTHYELYLPQKWASLLNQFFRLNQVVYHHLDRLFVYEIYCV